MNTSGARADILRAVRRAIDAPAGGRAADYESVERKYIAAGTLDAGPRLALFLDRLVHYHVGVHETGPSGVAATMAKACAARGKRRLLVPDGFPVDVIPQTVEARPDTGLSYEELDRCDGVLTVATLAIALTGTIVLTHGPGEGRRAATLIPDYHLCVVRAEQIVETVPEAFRRLAALDPALVTTISGPSATADIEMIRVRGVHGPRTLDVILVG
ncbi:MAG: LUD domain-containing protein, partial [Vicinamibacterales bacterium]